MALDLAEGQRRERQLHETLYAVVRAESDHGERESLAAHEDRKAGWKDEATAFVETFNAGQDERREAHEHKWERLAKAHEIDWKQREQEAERKWRGISDPVARAAEQRAFHGRQGAAEDQLARTIDQADRQFRDEQRARRGEAIAEVNRSRRELFGPEITAAVAERRASLEQRDKLRAEFQQAQAKRPGPPPSRTPASIWSNERLAAFDRDEHHKSRRSDLAAEAQAAERRGDLATAKRLTLEGTHEDAAHRADVWRDLAQMEFLLRGETPAFREAMAAHGQAQAEAEKLADEVQKARGETEGRGKNSYELRPQFAREAAAAVQGRPQGPRAAYQAWATNPESLPLSPPSPPKASRLQALAASRTAQPVSPAQEQRATAQAPDQTPTTEAPGRLGRLRQQPPPSPPEETETRGLRR